MTKEKFYKVEQLKQIRESMDTCVETIELSDIKTEEYKLRLKYILDNPERKHDYKIVDKDLSYEISEYRDYFNSAIETLSFMESKFSLYDNYVYESIRILWNDYKYIIDLYLYKTVDLKSSNSKHSFLYSFVSGGKEIPYDLKVILVNYSELISKLFDCFSKESGLRNLKKLAQVENKLKKDVSVEDRD